MPRAPRALRGHWTRFLARSFLVRAEPKKIGGPGGTSNAVFRSTWPVRRRFSSPRRPPRRLGPRFSSSKSRFWRGFFAATCRSKRTSPDRRFVRKKPRRNALRRVRATKSKNRDSRGEDAVLARFFEVATQCDDACNAHASRMHRVGARGEKGFDDAQKSSPGGDKSLSERFRSRFAARTAPSERSSSVQDAPWRARGGPRSFLDVPGRAQERSWGTPGALLGSPGEAPERPRSPPERPEPFGRRLGANFLRFSIHSGRFSIVFLSIFR